MARATSDVGYSVTTARVKHSAGCRALWPGQGKVCSARQFSFSTTNRKCVSGGVASSSKRGGDRERLFFARHPLSTCAHLSGGTWRSGHAHFAIAGRDQTVATCNQSPLWAAAGWGSSHRRVRAQLLARKSRCGGRLVGHGRFVKHRSVQFAPCAGGKRCGSRR